MWQSRKDSPDECETFKQPRLAVKGILVAHPSCPYAGDVIIHLQPTTLAESFDESEIFYDQTLPFVDNEIVIKSEVDEDIAVVHNGKTMSAVPLIPGSRVSTVFKQYLERLTTNLTPGVFKDASWKKKRRGNTPKPYFAALTGQDITQIWTETFRLGQQYGNLQQAKFYNYLTTLVLKAKVKCIDSYGQSGAALDSHVHNILADVRKVILFQFYMFEEMVQRHLESEYNKKVKTSIQFTNEQRLHN